MSILSTLFDFMFPLTRTSFFDSDTQPLGVRIDSNQMMAINPATAMPMVGGVSGIDLRGNLWGQSDSSDNRDSCCSEGAFRTCSTAVRCLTLVRRLIAIRYLTET